MGAVDGPGLRFVVFMQGCPLRCAYCHNPDTWDCDGGTMHTAEEVLKRILRYKTYIQKDGGVTVSGGEPLLQWEFVEQLFILLKNEGIHTALDTSGIDGSFDESHEGAKRVLAHTDLVLCDLKFTCEATYRQYAGADFARVLSFLRLTEHMAVPLWIRHVVVPDLTDGEAHIKEVFSMAKGFSNFEKLELLPFRKLCQSKYEDLGISFPLSDTPEMSQTGILQLYRSIGL